MQMDLFPGWDQIDGSSVSEEETERAYHAVMMRARRLEAALDAPKTRRWPRSAWIMAAAALVAVLLVPSLYFFFTRNNAPAPVAVNYSQCTTTQGETCEVVLPDQSRVVLNAESVLIYPDVFDGERQVFLSGEAIFDVTASEDSPFLVKTPDVTVRVHGTRFNVKAYYGDPMVTTTLSRGAVTVWPNRAPERTVELLPDQSCTYDRATGSLMTARVNSLESMSWESGALCFRSEDIHSVIRLLQRRFGVRVYLTTSNYDNAVITARFIHGETLDDLMEALCSIIPGMHYTHEGDTIYLK